MSCQCLAHQLGLPSQCTEKTSSEFNLQYPEIDADLSPIHDDETELRGSYNKSRKPRSQKRDANLKDQQSTGRKRAAKLYPFIPERHKGVCEWREKANCGGGVNPIRGCLSGVQNARHHGPDKSTSNNDSGNVHRICDYCHNRWHAANDPGYDWNATSWPSHSPTPMTTKEREEAMLDEMRYKASKTNKQVVD